MLLLVYGLDFIQGVPSADDEIGTIRLTRTSAQHDDYYTYTEDSGESGNVESVGQSWQNVRYFNMFMSNPSAGDQTSNAFNIHEAKSLVEIDAPQFISQRDTPASYSGQAGRFLKVNPEATGLEFTEVADTLAGGNAVGEKVAQSANLPTSVLADNTAFNPNWTVTTTKAGYLTGGGNSILGVPRSPDSVVLLGFWVMSHVGTDEPTVDNAIQRAFMPYGPGILSSEEAGTGNTRDRSYCTVGFTPANRTSSHVTIQYAVDNIGFSSFITLGDGTPALPANSRITVWEAVVKGSKGDPGPAGISDTPKRVTTLPATIKEGEEVYLTTDYSKTNGVDIVTSNFANTSAGGEGIGTRGWIKYLYLGSETHGALPDDFRAITETRVYVRKGTQTDLSTIRVGASYTAVLTRVVTDSTNNKLPPYNDDQPEVDYYTIFGGMPSGNWKDLRFVRSNGVVVPASFTVQKGRYLGSDDTWQKNDFSADPVEVDRELKFRVEETVPGGKEDKSITLSASGSSTSLYYTLVNPFPGEPVERISFYPSSFGVSTDDQTNRNRWAVQVPLAGFQDSEAPHILEVGTTQYGLSYYETDAGFAIYRTPVVASADRASGSALTHSLNIQRFDGIWLGVSNQQKLIRTIDKPTIKRLASGVDKVHALPSNPYDGMTIEPLENITVLGGAELRAAEAVGSGANTYGGYVRSGTYIGVPGQALGSLTPDDPRILRIVSYANSFAAGTFRNKTSIQCPTSGGNAFTPTLVWINGQQYRATAISGATGHYELAGLDGSFIKAGERYFVNAENASRTRVYPNGQLDAGKRYVYNGLFWLEEATRRTDAEINSLADGRITATVTPNALIANQGQTALPKFWFGTEAQYNAITTKDPNTLYYRRS